MNVSAYAVDAVDGIHGNIPGEINNITTNRKEGYTMKMITRTISERTCKVMTLNIKTAEVSVNEYSLGSANYTTKKKALEALKARYETVDVRLVEIVGESSRDVLYCMTEEAFIKNAIAVKDVKEARAYFAANKDAGEEIEAVEV